jgi:multimeric flavodoxin WrbA
MHQCGRVWTRAFLAYRIEAADALVRGSPVNCGTINALTQRFVQRTLVYGYWPWGVPSPKLRHSHLTRKAVLVSASGAPGFIGHRSLPG